MITAKWTGAYPNLCSGRWEITINGILIVCSKDNYDSILGKSMDTLGSYSTWSFGDDWDEHWEEEESGVEFIQWLDLQSTKELFSLIADNDVQITDTQRHELYVALQENDWRAGSCGGCI